MARQKKTTAGATGLAPFYWVIALLAAVGVAVLLWIAFGPGGSAATEPVEVEGLDDPQALVAAAEGVAAGDADAPVRVIEFGDYMCPGCAVFATRIKPALLQRYAESGQIQFIYYDFPLPGHQHSFIAARAARCAGAQDRFWEYHDLLFARQREWSFERNPLGLFADYARTVGLDVSEFESCVRSDRFADVVTANAMLGQQLGVNATPTVIVNGRRVGDFDFESISRVIEQELGGAPGS